MKTKAKALTGTKLIEAAFSRLDFLNNIDWTSHRERLLEACIAEEKGHRGFASDFNKYHPGAISIRGAAQLFAVKRIAEYLSGERMPRGKNYLHCQKSCFYAAGLVDEHRKAIRKAWRGLDVKAIAALDYVQFVRVKEVAA